MSNCAHKQVMEANLLEQNYETIDLCELFFIIKNNIVAIIAVTVLFAVAGGMVTMFMITPMYEASATMIVNTRQDQTANVTNDQINSAKNLVDTYAIIIKSDTVLSSVISDLNLDMTYSQLSSSVTVSAVDSTQVMQVSVQNADPALAKSIVAEITAIAPEIILDKVEAGSVKVISEARAGDKPVSPSLTKNVAIAALLGLVLSVGFVLLREMLNNTFKSDEDIQKNLGIPVLGVIPRVEDNDNGK
ncbi:MAG: capsular biosynthesis protein [Clostridia bacterium]|nr:capsular biosynthesis protein [Clostridia bacterium]